ncbi:MAG: hypothetical protein SGI92_20015 [Bryobacteraceae bacterium]|nr:hypothetical protein [Bryobacteraceae bacterium]
MRKILVVPDDGGEAREYSLPRGVDRWGRSSGRRHVLEHRLPTRSRSTGAIELLSRRLKDTVPPSSKLLIDALEAFIGGPKQDSAIADSPYHVGLSLT